MIGPLAAGVVALAVFAIRALRAHGPAEPVIDLRLFRVRSFRAAASLMFVAGLSMYGRCCCSRCTTSRSAGPAR